MPAGVDGSLPLRRWVDGERVEVPGGQVWLPCDGCGSKLRFLTALRGRLLCRECYAVEWLGQEPARGRRKW